MKQTDIKKRTLWIASGAILIGLSLLLLVLSFIPGWSERADPAILFLVLSAGFILCILNFRTEWHWRFWLAAPAGLFAAMGLVFTMNAVTGSSQAWAYGWLLCVAGLAGGFALAARWGGYAPIFYTAGLQTALGALALFAIFGAIAGGALMRVVALLLLAAEGVLLLRRGSRSAGNPESPLQVTLSSAAKKPADAESAPLEPLVEPLSKREIEVLQAIEAGLTNQEIAAQLVIAPSTVKTHINNIYAKLGAQTRTQAVRRARDLGLL